jgi:mRNA interferase YafO
LRHLHLAETGTWPLQKRQYARTSDRWLIYCSGFWYPNTYLLIAVLEPEAHTQATRTVLLNGLVRIAEDFRNKF